MAGDGTLLVNFNTLGQAVADIERAIGKLRTELETLDHEGKKLLGGWDGNAQIAYHDRQGRWTRSANELTVILQNIKHALQESLTDYSTTERQAAARFQ
jgi:6 kDa early secretory antigenic target